MIYGYKQYEVRKYLRKIVKHRKKKLFLLAIGTIFFVEKHMELLNLNDDEYKYIQYLCDVEV